MGTEIESNRTIDEAASRRRTVERVPVLRAIHTLGYNHTVITENSIHAMGTGDSARYSWQTVR
jgi:hypothetical protein